MNLNDTVTEKKNKTLDFWDFISLHLWLFVQ